MRAFALFLMVWAVTPAQQEIGWLKLDQAKAVGSHTGKLILVCVSCDPRSGSAPCSGGIAERCFTDPAVLKRQDEFHFVRVCEKKTAQSVKASKAPEAIFMDSDGDEVYRAAISDGGSLERAMTAAQQRYGPREVAWLGEIPATSGGRPLLVVGFDDDKAETLKAFEDKTLVKFHDRIEFVRLPLKKDAEAARKWGVTQGPAIFICDATKENPEKNTLEKLSGKKNAGMLKAALLRALARIEQKK